jgi:hypothetical protein
MKGFKKHVMHTRLDIYVFLNYYYHPIYNSSKASKKNTHYNGKTKTINQKHNDGQQTLQGK